MRILCPTDGAPRAAAAIDRLIRTVAAGGVRVDLLAVANLGEGSVRTASAARRAALQEHLAQQRARLEGAGFTVEVSLRTGHAADEIVRFAETTGPDLVVLGSRSPDGGGAGYSGRVAGTVARHCHVPVLIARDGGPIRSIVLGYDESPDADAALTLVETLPWCNLPAVAVCSAYEIDEPLVAGGATESRHAAEEIAVEAARRLGRSGFTATAHALHGRASAQLEVLAAQLDADLIVVGSRGLSGMERFLLGSTSDELVGSARTSILVVRT